MKITAERLESYQGITERTDITGVPYEAIDHLKGVQQLDRLDEANALILVSTDSGSLDLKTIPLP